MRLILHIGMPKAGSTALQKALAKSRRALRKAGVLYPRGASNHNFLIAGIVRPKHVGRTIAQCYADDIDALGADFTA